MRSTGILAKCLTCTDSIIQGRLNALFAEIKQEPKASKYLATQDISQTSI